MSHCRAALLLIVLWPAVPAAEDWHVLRLTPAGAVVVPVEIQGEGPFAFLLDTGSSRSAISASLARRLGTREVGETTVLTPAGRAVRPLAPLPRISLGGSPPAASLAMILPDDDLARGFRADGILGADVLLRFVLTIDYAQARISWTRAGGVDTPFSLPLREDEGRLAVTVPHPACAIKPRDCAPLILIPDSGADGVVLFNRPERAMRFVTPLDAGAVRSLAGVRVAQRVRIDAASLEAVGLHGQIASLVDLPAEDSLAADGLLPLHLFARVTLDGPGKTLTLVRR